VGVGGVIGGSGGHVVSLASGSRGFCQISELTTKHSRPKHMIDHLD